MDAEWILHLTLTVLLNGRGMDTSPDPDCIVQRRSRRLKISCQEPYTVGSRGQSPEAG